MALRPDSVVPLGMRDGRFRHHNVMKRRLLNLLTAVSLLLCALSTMALAWVLYNWRDAARSNTARGWSQWEWEPTGDGVDDAVGVGFCWVVVNDHVLQLVYARADMSRAEAGQFKWDTLTTLPNPPGSRFGLRRHLGRGVNLSVPAWLAALALAVLPAWWCRRWWRLRTGRRRRSEGHCATCGYDLRATPGRCPECGAVAAW